MTISRFFLTLFTALLSVGATHADTGGTASAHAEYGIHLYFNEKEFIDVLTLEQTPEGELRGRMHVPDDFDGELQNIQLDSAHLSFDLLVPKNASRPTDLLFHYQGTFFDSSHRQLVGYVTIRGAPEFVASFVGFLRPAQ